MKLGDQLLKVLGQTALKAHFPSFLYLLRTATPKGDLQIQYKKPPL